LSRLTNFAEPPLRKIRCSKTASAHYGFGDASGRGFGSTLKIGNRIHYEYGQWSETDSFDTSSNWKELGNLVMALERKASEGYLDDCEVFLFTDNTTAEAAYWKGSTKSKTLFEWVLRLKTLEMQYDLILHVIHVSGTRMILQGTDGISRGDHSEGVMVGRTMLGFVPLNLGALERSPSLVSWVDENLLPDGFELLSPEGWFSTAHAAGNFLWAPPPAAADVVVEQLGKARHKRPHAMHIILVPRLMTGRWRKILGREADCYLKLCDCNLWPESCCEPLLMFFCLPFRAEEPCLSDRKSLLEKYAGTLLRAGVWESDTIRGWNILRKFLCEARTLCPV
jgi:hypothetical protein